MSKMSVGEVGHKRASGHKLGITTSVKAHGEGYLQQIVVFFPIPENSRRPVAVALGCIAVILSWLQRNADFMTVSQFHNLFSVAIFFSCVLTLES